MDMQADVCTTYLRWDLTYTASVAGPGMGNTDVPEVLSTYVQAPTNDTGPDHHESMKKNRTKVLQIYSK